MPPRKSSQTQQARQQADRLGLWLTQTWRQAVLLSRPVAADVVADCKVGILWSDRQMDQWLRGRTTRSNRRLIKTCARVGLAIIALLLVQLTVLLLLTVIVSLSVKSLIRLNSLPKVEERRFQDPDDWEDDPY